MAKFWRVCQVLLTLMVAFATVCPGSSALAFVPNLIESAPAPSEDDEGGKEEQSGKIGWKQQHSTRLSPRAANRPTTTLRHSDETTPHFGHPPAETDRCQNGLGFRIRC